MSLQSSREALSSVVTSEAAAVGAVKSSRTPILRSVPEHEPAATRRLKDRICVVTGASHGIGQAICRRFADEGAWVLLTDIDVDAGQAAAADIRQAGGRADFRRVDIGSREQIESAVKRVADEFGRLDVLCNNAAFIGTWHDVLNATDEEWD